MNFGSLHMDRFHIWFVIANFSFFFFGGGGGVEDLNQVQDILNFCYETC